MTGGDRGHFLITKIGGMKALAQNRQKNETSWSEVVKSSKKLVLTVGQPIPVLHNRFQPLCNLNCNDHEGCRVMHEQKGEKMIKKTDKEIKLKKRIPIIGDSHTREMATIAT
jgi:hypothetical protein